MLCIHWPFLHKVCIFLKCFMEGGLWKHILLKEDVFFYLVLIQLDDPYYSYVHLCIDHLNFTTQTREKCSAELWTRSSWKVFWKFFIYFSLTLLTTKRFQHYRPINQFLPPLWGFTLLQWGNRQKNWFGQNFWHKLSVSELHIARFLRDNPPLNIFGTLKYAPKYAKYAIESPKCKNHINSDLFLAPCSLAP